MKDALGREEAGGREPFKIRSKVVKAGSRRMILELKKINRVVGSN